jgi:NRPS condensation-like uncharacterized protein
VIAPPEPRKLSVIDFSQLPVSDREAALRERIIDEMRQPLSLERGPLSRVTLLRRGENDYALVASTHHIVHDGWSMGLLLGELAILYQAFRTGASQTCPSYRFNMPTSQHGNATICTVRLFRN